MKKIRADQLLVEQGLAETRSKARALIMAGEVLADNVRVDKAGQILPPEVQLSLKNPLDKFVSRGGRKLAGALKDFGFNVEGLSVLDVGASTGGFTDCLLQNGAAHVTAVDVGYGQFHWRLRQDARVEVRERVNARYLTPGEFDRKFDLIVIDVSFISLELILPAMAPLLNTGGTVLALVKTSVRGRTGTGRAGRGGPRSRGEESGCGAGG